MGDGDPIRAAECVGSIPPVASGGGSVVRKGGPTRGGALTRDLRGLLAVPPGRQSGRHLMQGGPEGVAFLLLQRPLATGLDDAVQSLEIDFHLTLALHGGTLLDRHEKSCRPEDDFWSALQDSVAGSFLQTGAPLTRGSPAAKRTWIW